jgi:hypothetical protein
MRTFLFESVADPMTPGNWGAFMVGVPDDMEWSWHSHVAPGLVPLFEQLGHQPGDVWVSDLQTGEGAWFRMGGDARADLGMHRIHVTAPFEGFLEWLYLQDLAQLWQLPHVVKVADAIFSFREYRRLGPHPVSFTLKKGHTMEIMWAGKPHMVTCDGLTDEGAVIRSLTEAEQLELFGPDEQEDPGDKDPAPGDPEREDSRVNEMAGAEPVPALDGPATTLVLPAADGGGDAAGIGVELDGTVAKVTRFPKKHS